MAGYRVQALYRPGRNVGGDLYDVQRIGDRFLALVIADASGHGVSAAMLCVLFKHRLRLIDEGSGAPLWPAQALTRMNSALMTDVSAPGVFVTAAFCLLDTESGELVVASAGQTPLVVLREDGASEDLPPTGPALGLYEDAAIGEHRLQLGMGDRVLMVTDGLFDLGGAEPPTVGSLGTALRRYDDQADALRRAFFDIARGQERQERDDITLLLLEARSGKSHFMEMADSEAIAASASEEEPALISHAESDAGTIICLTGRVTWMLGDALLQAATAVIGSGRELILDLGDCSYLDSTLLGTLHEIIGRGDVAGRPVAIQRASPALEAAFEELSMQTVLSHRRATPVPMPDKRRPIDVSDADARRHQLRLLKAHEVLADLSEHNRAEFAEVVAAMRAELR